MPGPRPFCTSCGQRLAPDTAFCTSCGAAVAAPPPVAPDGAGPSPSAPPAKPPTQVFAASVPPAPYAADALFAPAQRPRRRRGGLVAAAVLVLLACGGGAAWWLLGGEDPAPVSAGARPATPATSASPSAGASSSPSASAGTTTSPSTSPSTSTSAAPVRMLTCWDGASAPTAKDCGEPEGLAGIQWLFRGLDVGNCVQAVSGRERVGYSCGDDPVKINVSHWRDHQTGLAYYEGNTGGTATQLGDGRLIIQGSAPRSGEFKTAVLYDGGRWGVTLYSYDSSALPPAVAGLKMRPGKQYAGR